ncbi:MAG: hypothetical protein OHK0038_22020 [Flammeovirgaceae bacterium]
MKRFLFYIIGVGFLAACKKETESPTPATPASVEFAWLRSVGGANDEVIRGTFLDAQNNTHIVGTFRGTMSIGGQSLASNGFLDLFMAKLDPNGNFVWQKSFGSSTGSDLAVDVDGDAMGNMYVTGMFSKNINFGNGILLNAGTSDDDVFVAKFDANGTCLWAKMGIGDATDYGNEINVTSDNKILTIGFANRGITFENTTLNNATNYGMFVSKHNSSGALEWAKLFSSTGEVSGRGISADASGNALITGTFQGTLTLGTTSLTATSANGDVFIAKLDANGNTLWAKKFGQTGDNYARGIDSDSEGNIYVSGVYDTQISFGSISLTSNGQKDIFLVKFDANGNAIWAKSIGSTGNDEGCEIEVNTNGNVFFTGSYTGTLTLNNETFAAKGLRDVFVAKTDKNGNFIWQKTMGSPQDDVNYAIGLNRTNENVVTVGTFASTFSQAAQSVTSLGSYDSYISLIK